MIGLWIVKTNNVDILYDRLLGSLPTCYEETKNKLKRDFVNTDPNKLLPSQISFETRCPVYLLCVSIIISHFRLALVQSKSLFVLRIVHTLVVSISEAIWRCAKKAISGTAPLVRKKPILMISSLISKSLFIDLVYFNLDISKK
jgi:hypothetical protein